MAAEVNKPDFSYQWSSGGAIVAPSNVKIQTGWTAEVPPFQWENWSQNRQDNAILHLFQKGISEWDAASNYYFTTSGTRSYVQGSDGIIYVAVADSIGQNPTTDVSDTYWKVAFADNSTALTTTTGDARYTQKANNLSDLNSVVTARNNLSVYSKVESDALLPAGYFYGFTLSNNVILPNTTLDVGIGQAKTSDNLLSVSLLSGLSGILQSSGSWAAGNNQNKLDTGAKANSTCYHVFVIRKVSDGSADLLFSLSATAPTMPSGYSGFHLINFFRTNASGNIIPFINVGDLMWYKAPIKDVAITGLPSGQTVATHALSLSTAVRVEAILYCEAVGDQVAVYLSNPDADDINPVGVVAAYIGGQSLQAGGASAVESTGQQLRVLSSTTGTVRGRYKTDSAATTGLTIVTAGWRFLR